jgi:hypothetical protein
MKNSISWYLTPYSPLKVEGRFGGTGCLRGEEKAKQEIRMKEVPAELEAASSSRISIYKSCLLNQ